MANTMQDWLNMMVQGDRAGMAKEQADQQNWLAMLAQEQNASQFDRSLAQSKELSDRAFNAQRDQDAYRRQQDAIAQRERQMAGISAGVLKPNEGQAFGTGKVVGSDWGVRPTTPDEQASFALSLDERKARLRQRIETEEKEKLWEQYRPEGLDPMQEAYAKQQFMTGYKMDTNPASMYFQQVLANRKPDVPLIPFLLKSIKAYEQATRSVVIVFF